MTNDTRDRISNIGAGMVPTYHATESVEEAKAVVEQCRSATEELRRMLDERGVEWRKAPHYSSESKDEETIFTVDGFEWYAHEFGEGYLQLRTAKFIITPQQAIAATLGTGTCEADETETIKALYNDNHHIRHITIHVMECTECGHTYEHVNGDYEYCPHCGRKRRDFVE